MIKDHCFIESYWKYVLVLLFFMFKSEKNKTLQHLVIAAIIRNKKLKNNN